MYKLTIQKIEDFKTIKEMYFDCGLDMVDYMRDTFPYFNDFQYSPSCGYISGYIRDTNNTVVFGYVSEFINITNVDTKLLAWGDSTKLEIFDVFRVPNVNTLMEAFEQFVDTMKSTEDYCDSWRIGLYDNEDSMVQYNKYITCCGSLDIIETIDGVRYSFGCNFGH